MKKVLSFLLVLMLSLTVAGISQEASATTADATIYLHLYTHDGDYTDNAAGVWDGKAWNSYGAHADANGLITIEYTTAELAERGIGDSGTDIEIKPVFDKNDGDNTTMAPGDGKLFLDIADLKDGSATEIHAYYFEGANDLYVKNDEANGIALFYYVDPRVATEPDAYVDWGMHTWNNGTTGSSAQWDAPIEFYADAMIDAGEYTGEEAVMAQVGVIEVSADAQNSFGFIVHKGDEKAYASDIFVDATVPKAGGVEVWYYLYDTEAPVQDFAAYTTDVAAAYKEALKNKFRDTTVITNPNTIDATMFMKKQPWELIPELFTVKDSTGTVMPITGMVIPGAHQVGKVDSALVENADNFVRLLIDSDVAIADLGIMGNFQGWSDAPGAPLTSSTTTEDGLYVFEFTTSEDTVEFKVLKESNGTPGITWADTAISGGDNVVVNATEYTLVNLVDADDSVTVANGNMSLTIYFRGLDEAANAGIIGTFQTVDFDDENTVLPTLIDGFGNHVLEVKVDSVTEEFKILVDNNDNGLNDMDSITVDPFEMNGNTVYVFDVNTYELTPLGTTIVNESMKYTNMQLTVDGTFMHNGDYTIEYVEAAAIVDDPATTEVDETTPAVIISIELGFRTDVNLEEADVVEQTGTYAVSPTEIQVGFENAQSLFDVNSVLKLYDANDTMINLLADNYMLNIGELNYTPTLTCEEPSNLVMVYFDVTTEITDLTQLGMVGSIQETDWNPESAINPTGMDANGYYVFEVCLPETDTQVAFKILFDADGAFNWGDTELVSSDIQMTVADGPEFYLEEGSGALNVKTSHRVKLDSALDKTSSYYVVLEDATGFSMKMDLPMDTEAPTVTATIDPAASFTIENSGAFDVNDYFTVLNFVDTREGEMSFTVKTPLDFSTLGSQTMTIAATDMWGNEGTYDIVFTIVDTTDPELVIEGAKEYEAGTEAPTWAVFAYSNDGTVTVDASDVNMDAEGVYYVNYTATDDAGNTTVGTLEVTITAAEAETGCFGSFSLGSSIGLIVAAVAGGTVLFFVRRKH